MTQQQTQPIPHSPEAEQSIIGGLILDGQLFGDVSARVKPSDFFRRDHQVIYTAIERLCRQAKPVDLVTVKSELEQSGELEIAGGLAYLGNVSANTPGVSAITAWADIVADKARERALIADLDKAKAGDEAALARIRSGKYTNKARLNISTGLGDWDKPYQWLINGWIPDECIGFLTGPSGNGKTFVAIDLAFAVMSGGQFLGQGHLEGEPGAVAYFTIEGRQGIAHRMKAYVERYGLPPEVWRNRLWQCNDPISFKEVTPDAVAASLKEWSNRTGETLRLVIFDTFRAYCGGGRENDSGDTELAIAWMRQLRELIGGSVICIHHSRKNSEETQIKPGCDADSVLRGSSNIKAGAETVIGVVMATAESDSGHTMDRVPFVWPAKLKDAPSSKPVAAPIETQRIRLSNGDEVDVGVVSHHGEALTVSHGKTAGGLSLKEQAVYGAVQARMLNDLPTDKSLIRDDIKAQEKAAGMKKPGANFATQLAKCIEKGAIVERDGKLFTSTGTRQDEKQAIFPPSFLIPLRR